MLHPTLKLVELFGNVQSKYPNSSLLTPNREFASKPQLFIDGTEEGDVIQGGLGDCWFLGALAVVATRDDLIRELVVSAHPELGFYQFRFFKNGAWSIVTVDDLIPCVRQAKGFTPFAARCRDPNEMWVCCNFIFLIIFLNLKSN